MTTDSGAVGETKKREQDVRERQRPDEVRVWFPLGLTGLVPPLFPREPDRCRHRTLAIFARPPKRTN